MHTRQDHPDHSDASDASGPDGWPLTAARGARRLRRGRGPGSRGPGRGNVGGGFGPGFGRGGPFGRRAGRGDVRAAILALLAEQPMHGYQMIAELSERTGGAWTPSPGSVYPTLQLLEEEELVEPTADGGKKVFHLTETGRAAAAGGDPAPWASVAHDTGQRALGDSLQSLMAAFQQVARTGTPEQVERASAVLNDARKALYLILAEDAASD